MQPTLRLPESSEDVHPVAWEILTTLASCANRDEGQLLLSILGYHMHSDHRRVHVFNGDQIVLALWHEDEIDFRKATDGWYTIKFEHLKEVVGDQSKLHGRA